MTQKVTQLRPQSSSTENKTQNPFQSSVWEARCSEVAEIIAHEARTAKIHMAKIPLPVLCILQLTDWQTPNTLSMTWTWVQFKLCFWAWTTIQSCLERSVCSRQCILVYHKTFSIQQKTQNIINTEEKHLMLPCCVQRMCSLPGDLKSNLNSFC